MIVKFLFYIVVFFPVILSGKTTVNDVKSKKEQSSNVSKAHHQTLLDIIDSQLNALQTNQSDHAYNEFTSTDFKKNTSIERFNNLIAKFQFPSHNKLFQFQSFYLEDGIATVSGELVSTEEVSIPIEYDFVLEDGKWKILGIQIYQAEMSLPSQKAL